MRTDDDVIEAAIDVLISTRLSDHAGTDPALIGIGVGEAAR